MGTREGSATAVEDLQMAGSLVETAVATAATALATQPEAVPAAAETDLMCLRSRQRYDIDAFWIFTLKPFLTT